MVYPWCTHGVPMVFVSRIGTLLDVWQDGINSKIPYRSMQLDSWWYPKGYDNGVTKWEAMEYIFPNGLNNFHKKLGGIPFTAHNRWWSIETPYAQANGGKYDFIVEKTGLKPPTSSNASFSQTDESKNNKPLPPDIVDYKEATKPYGAAMPTDKTFWDDLFEKSVQWGLYTYEQDWLHNEFLTLNSTKSSLTLGRNWLLQMGNAASRHNVKIQYCMGYPRFFLQSLEIESITQIRVSEDYGPSTDDGRPNQWSIGDTSLLAYALNLAPFKDVFWSSVEESDNRYNGREAKPALESAVTTLSMGPVGPGDKIGSMDRDLIMRSCNEDGLLLKPSRPLTTIDEVYKHRVKFESSKNPSNDSKSFLVQSTYSTIKTITESYTWNIILAPAVNETVISIYPSMISFPLSSEAADIHPLISYQSMYNHKSNPNPILFKSLQIFDQFTPFHIKECNPENFELWYTAPIFPGGLIFLGEVGKWTPVSPKRFISLEHVVQTGDETGRYLEKAASSLQIEIAGAVDEKILITFAHISDLSKQHSLECQIGVDGRALIMISKEADNINKSGKIKSLCMSY